MISPNVNPAILEGQLSLEVAKIMKEMGIRVIKKYIRAHTTKGGIALGIHTQKFWGLRWRNSVDPKELKARVQKSVMMITSDYEVDMWVPDTGRAEERYLKIKPTKKFLQQMRREAHYMIIEYSLKKEWSDLVLQWNNNSPKVLTRSEIYDGIFINGIRSQSNLVREIIEKSSFEHMETLDDVLEIFPQNEYVNEDMILI